MKKQKIKYRSFKNLDVIALNEDMSKVNIQVQSNKSTNDVDVNEIYDVWQLIIFPIHFFYWNMFIKNSIYI
jgi:hypothetical protein